MLSLLELSNLRRYYSDITSGYSHARYNNNLIYIKHFTLLDQSNLDYYYNIFYQHATSKGVLKEADRLESLNKDGLWTKKDESELNNLKYYIDNLEISKKRLVLQSQIKEMQKQINEEKDKYSKKLQKRNELIDLTAENFASKKLNEKYVYFSMYKDSNLKEKYFTEEDIDYFDDYELRSIIAIYNNVLKEFNNLNIRKIALSSFFQNAFYLCDDNPYTFYGEPIVKLTFFKTELFSYGKYYRHILSQESKPPEEIMENLDVEGFENWFSGMKNSENLLKEKGDKETKMLFGATDEDLKSLGIHESKGKSLQEIAAEKGGNLNMMDLMKLHGAI